MSTIPHRSPPAVVHVAAEDARATIAHLVLGPPAAPVQLRGITLAAHQREAVTLLRREIARSGGALLADAVGLGKTYVALALAADAARPLVVAPAALRRMWSDAMARAGVTAPFVSTQRLSLGVPALDEPDLVVIDEAHHFRNAGTRRYASLSALTHHARVLLLSATPVHNAGRELDALLALFLGSSAATLDAAARARCIVRREAGSDAWGELMPRVETVRRLELSPRDELVEAIASLPAPVPPSDGGDAGALLTFSLLRQWSSSEGALAAALRRRLAQAAALIAALEEGRHPSRTELSAWRFAEDALQLAFPGLVTSGAISATGELVEHARRHEAAVRELLDRVRASAGADVERAQCLRALRAEHRGERIVAFSQFADTIEALWRELRGDAGVCALTGRGARVAGGAISRGEALARFAPTATAHRSPPDAERIDLLLTTDLLSEGVNLQDASVVVHLDLPWTPARLEQRVGRLARPGAPRERVAVYAFAPPASVAAVLAVERRLQDKLVAAARSAGVSGAILPDLLRTLGADEQSPAQDEEMVRRTLDSWRREGTIVPLEGGRIIAASARSSREGCLAVVSSADGPKLVASLGGSATDDPRIVSEAAALASGGAGVDRPAATDACIARIETWIATRRASEAVDLRLVARERARRLIHRRVATILARAARHQRARLAPLADDARAAANAPLGGGAERVLRELADAPLADEAWLRAVAAFGHAHRRNAHRPLEHGGEIDRASGGSPIRVLLVMSP